MWFTQTESRIRCFLYPRWVYNIVTQFFFTTGGAVIECLVSRKLVQFWPSLCHAKSIALRDTERARKPDLEVEILSQDRAPWIRFESRLKVIEVLISLV